MQVGEPEPDPEAPPAASPPLPPPSDQAAPPTTIPPDVERDYLDWLENQPPITRGEQLRRAIFWLVIVGIALGVCALILLIVRHFR
jgi:hypothetical protein